MPLILPGNVASATAATTYDVANSCRFNSADTAYMTKTLGTPTDADKYTFSFWVKRCKLGSQQSIFRSTNGNDDSHVTFRSDDTLEFQEYGGLSSIGEIQTTQVFRDVSAWYHIVLVWDSGNGTAGNRMRMYVNGTEVTSFGTDTNPSQDADSFFNKASAPLHFGRTDYSGGGDYFDGYVAEVVMCDGQAYAASDFGEFDEDSPTIWKPKDVSGLTFGTNGFYLDFEASDNLGNDANGGTDLTETNLAATDQATDTPTNNFCTLNPLVRSANFTFSEGNCKFESGSSDAYGAGIGTFGLTAGKWYWEVKIGESGEDWRNHTHGVISELTPELYSYATGLQNDTGVTQYANNDGGAVSRDGTVAYNNYGELDIDDILGIAFNADDNQITFLDNGSALVSDYATSTTRGVIFPFIRCGGSTIAEVNFGGCSSFTISSAANDENGYGNFEIAPPSGYLALCSKNLGSDGG